MWELTRNYPKRKYFASLPTSLYICWPTLNLLWEPCDHLGVGLRQMWFIPSCECGTCRASITANSMGDENQGHTRSSTVFHRTTVIHCVLLCSSTVFHWSTVFHRRTSAAEFTSRVMGGWEQGVQPVGLQMSREQTAHNLPHTMYNVNKPRTCNIQTRWTQWR